MKPLGGRDVRQGEQGSSLTDHRCLDSWTQNQLESMEGIFHGETPPLTATELSPICALIRCLRNIGRLVPEISSFGLLKRLDEP